MPPTILITRPESSALTFADQLRDRFGHDLGIVISPAMQISYLQDAPDLNGVKTLIFTSRYGVDAFVRLSSRRDIPCYAVSPATAERARQAGLQVTDGGGDYVELSAKMIKDGAQGPVLHLRGEHAAGDICARLNDADIEITTKVLYRQDPAPLTPEARQCLTRESPVIVPLFSPRTAEIVFSDITPKAPLLIAAISDNAAKNVPMDQVKKLIVAKRPDGDSMLNALDTLIHDSKQLEGAYRAQ